MNETFAQVPGWPKYLISSMGRLFGPRGHQLAGFFDRDGYHCCYIGLRKQGKAIKLHRAVAEAFLGGIPTGMQVNHKNGVRNDNRLENLEVVTGSENMRHSYQVLGRVFKNTNPSKGVSHHNSKLNEEIVREIRALYAGGMTQPAIAAKFGIGQNHVSRLVRRESWAHVT